MERKRNGDDDTVIQKLIPIDDEVKTNAGSVIYKGVTWMNTHDNSEKWLKSIYDIEDEGKDNK